jgi:hypothetical protein
VQQSLVVGRVMVKALSSVVVPSMTGLTRVIASIYTMDMGRRKISNVTIMGA